MTWTPELIERLKALKNTSFWSRYQNALNEADPVAEIERLRQEVERLQQSIDLEADAALQRQIATASRHEQDVDAALLWARNEATAWRLPFTIQTDAQFIARFKAERAKETR